LRRRAERQLALPGQRAVLAVLLASHAPDCCTRWRSRRTSCATNAITGAAIVAMQPPRVTLSATRRRPLLAAGSRGLMLTLVVVKAKIARQVLFGVDEVIVCVQVNLLVLDSSPQALDEDVVAAPAFAIHADLDVVPLEHVGEGLGGKLR